MKSIAFILMILSQRQDLFLAGEADVLEVELVKTGAESFNFSRHGETR